MNNVTSFANNSKQKNVFQQNDVNAMTMYIVNQAMVKVYLAYSGICAANAWHYA